MANWTSHSDLQEVPKSKLPSFAIITKGFEFDTSILQVDSAHGNAMVDSTKYP